MHSKEIKLSDFHRIPKTKNFPEIKPKNITFRKTAKLRNLNSVATLEAHKSESGVGTNCYNLKGRQ